MSVLPAANTDTTTTTTTTTTTAACHCHRYNKKQPAFEYIPAEEGQAAQVLPVTVSLHLALKQVLGMSTLDQSFSGMFYIKVLSFSLSLYRSPLPSLFLLLFNCLPSTKHSTFCI